MKYILKTNFIEVLKTTRNKGKYNNSTYNWHTQQMASVHSATWPLKFESQYMNEQKYSSAVKVAGTDIWLFLLSVSVWKKRLRKISGCFSLQKLI